MTNKKKLVLLHSNDLHGDFVSKNIDEKLVGGVSMLSGYVNKVRNEEKNVLYTISGDMFRGSLIDSEFKGVSTIEIMNALAPNVATIGNHEIDYGIAHLLFLEKCARFPIINANVYIKTNHVRLFRGHYIKKIGGIKILFIGIITEEILAQTKQEELIGAFVDVKEASTEIGKICDRYQTEDIDLTVLLTHIGFEADKELAALLNPLWGVDLIIGGHTHTILEEPCVVNGIPIVQAGSGTNQIGRFDLCIDKETNSIESYTWQLIPIDEEHCPRDTAMEELIQKYKEVTDRKYSRYITRLKHVYTHPARNQETDVGKMFADAFADSLGLDLMVLASGSLRLKEFGPIVDYQHLLEMYPFGNQVIRVTLTGAQLKQMIRHIFREEALLPDAHTEFYQFSKGIRFVVSKSKKKVTDITWKGEPITDTDKFRVGMQVWHYKSMEEFFGLHLEEVKANMEPKVVCTFDTDVLDEYFSSMELVEVDTKARWIFEE